MADEKENDSTGLMSFSPGVKQNTARFEELRGRLASRQQEMQKKQMQRRLDKVEVDFDAMPQLVQQSVSTEAPSDSASGGDNFLVSSSSHLDVSAIPRGDESYRSSSATRLPVTSTPIVRPRSHSVIDDDKAVFKAPIAPVRLGSHSSFDPAEVLPPSTPLKKSNRQFSSMDFLLSVDEKMELQFGALASWANALLAGGVERDEVNLGKNKEEANKALAKLLAQQKTTKKSTELRNENVNARYREWVQSRRMDEYRKKAKIVFNNCENINGAIGRQVELGSITVRKDFKVYSDIGLQSTLLHVLFSFHPLWLHLGLEMVFAKRINIDQGETFAATIARFCQENLFVDKKLMKMKKVTPNGKVSLVTEEGTRVLHKHFVRCISQLFVFIEEAKKGGISALSPRLFTRTSPYKCMNDVFAEMSRELLSSSTKPYAKVLQQCGFSSTYKQQFYEEYTYKISAFSDLGDGVILGRLVELIAELVPNSLMAKLRNPGGDRLRKIGNVQAVLDALKVATVDTGNITPAQIVACNRPTIIELMWRLVGFYLERNGSFTLPVRCVNAFGDTTVMNIEEINNAENGAFERSDEMSDANAKLLAIGAEFGRRIGVKVKRWEALRDGRVLAEMWRAYTSDVPSLNSFSGNNLFERVYNAADSVLGVPRCVFEDDRSLSLFTRLFLERLGDLHMMHEAAVKIQRCWRRWKNVKRGVLSFSSVTTTPSTNTDDVDRLDTIREASREESSVQPTSNEDNDDQQQRRSSGALSSTSAATSTSASSSMNNLLGDTYVVLDGRQSIVSDGPLSEAETDEKVEESMKDETHEMNTNEVDITIKAEVDSTAGCDEEAHNGVEERSDEVMEGALALVELANSVTGSSPSSSGTSLVADEITDQHSHTDSARHNVSYESTATALSFAPTECDREGKRNSSNLFEVTAADISDTPFEVSMRNVVNADADLDAQRLPLSSEIDDHFESEATTGSIVASNQPSGEVEENRSPLVTATSPVKLFVDRPDGSCMALASTEDDKIAAATEEFDLYGVDLEEMAEKVDEMTEFLNASGDERQIQNEPTTPAPMDDLPVDVDDNEAEQEEEVYEHNEHGGVGLVLERACIDGETSFGWTEENGGEAAETEAEDEDATQVDEEDTTATEGQNSRRENDSTIDEEPLFVSIRANEEEENLDSEEAPPEANDAEVEHERLDEGPDSRPIDASNTNDATTSELATAERQSMTAKSNASIDQPVDDVWSQSEVSLSLLPDTEALRRLDPFTGFECTTDLAAYRFEKERMERELSAIVADHDDHEPPSNDENEHPSERSKRTHCGDEREQAANATAKQQHPTMEEMAKMFPENAAPPAVGDPLYAIYQRYRKLKGSQAELRRDVDRLLKILDDSRRRIHHNK